MAGPRGSTGGRYTAARPAMTRVVARGETTAGPDRDYTVKLDVPGLRPGTTYY